MKATVTPIHSERSQATVVEAVTRFERVNLAAGTARKYRHTLVGWSSSTRSSPSLPLEPTS